MICTFPLWFNSLENVIKKSRHSLDHTAALPWSICSPFIAVQNFSQVLFRVNLAIQYTASSLCLPIKIVSITSN